MKYVIVVDKQPKSNPSTEKKEYNIDIEELRAKGNIHDSLIIKLGKVHVLRRLSLSKYHVLSELEEPIKEPLPDINIELFDGDNYIYLVDMTGNVFYAQYLNRNAFNDVFATRTEMQGAIEVSSREIEISVDKKLTDYSTTEETKALIQLQADEIKEEVSRDYATQEELIQERSERIQKANEITQTVSKKVGNDEIISKINQSAEAVTIEANKLNLNGYVTVNDLKTAGKTTINGSNITTGTIDASKATITNINADNIKSGTITGRTISGGTINGAKITGGNISLSTTNNDSVMEIKDSKNSSKRVYMNEQYVVIDSIYGQNVASMGTYSSTGYGYVSVRGGGTTTINGSGVTTPTLTQTSLKSKKKYIKKLKANATDLIKNSDICLYNLKGEKAKSKKHIGLVIGDGYNCPNEVISEDGQGVEQYSMTSLAWKAIQELIEENSNLKQRIEKLEAK